MNFTVEQLEVFLLVFVRLSAFIYSAPFFSNSNVPYRLKAGLTFFVSAIVILILPTSSIKYAGIFGYAFLIIKEAIMGLVIGFMANICTMIIAFAGQLIDQEIGFSMVQEMNPTANFQTTITANLLTNTVMLVMLVSNLYLYVLDAIIDSFVIVPAGEVKINPFIYTVLIRFMTDYFLIAFRIILPVFVCILLTNVILAILAKVAPQMNMLVIGMQLKLLIGLAVLVMIASLLPAITDFIYNEMKVMIRLAIKMF